MNKKQQTEQEVFEHVNWCFKRASEISQADAEAIYSEFNEWIEYIEGENLSYIDVVKIEKFSK